MKSTLCILVLLGVSSLSGLYGQMNLFPDYLPGVKMVTSQEYVRDGCDRDSSLNYLDTIWYDALGRILRISAVAQNQFGLSIERWWTYDSLGRYSIVYFNVYQNRGKRRTVFGDYDSVILDRKNRVVKSFDLNKSGHTTTTKYGFWRERTIEVEDGIVRRDKRESSFLGVRRTRVYSYDDSAAPFSTVKEKIWFDRHNRIKRKYHRLKLFDPTEESQNQSYTVRFTYDSINNVVTSKEYIGKSNILHDSAHHTFVLNDHGHMIQCISVYDSYVNYTPEEDEIELESDTEIRNPEPSRCSFDPKTCYRYQQITYYSNP